MYVLVTLCIDPALCVLATFLATSTPRTSCSRGEAYPGLLRSLSSEATTNLLARRGSVTAPYVANVVLHLQVVASGVLVALRN